MNACRYPRSALAAALALLGAAAAFAGGSPENVLLIIDPGDPESLHVGNHYRVARDLPPKNVLYIVPGAADFEEFAAEHLDALFGTIAGRGLDDHVDYIVVAAGEHFFVAAQDLVSDPGCTPLRRFSLSSAYTMAYLAEEILGGGLQISERNQFYSITSPLRGFDSNLRYLFGSPSTLPGARQYFIGALLGYTGTRGNSPAETIAMIDRSVAADGTRPTGTFYFMNNTGDPARNVRAGQFGGAESRIETLGGQAEIINGVLPTGRHDCLGIMTGAANPNIDGADLTLIGGPICDHLTSYAGQFDNSSQTKVSRWIVKGASGAWGTVEEPCNYTQKFIHAQAHRLYFEGASLGEAIFRSVEFTPFQGLLYGDPLTRPYAHLPQVSVAGLPAGPISGTLQLTPSATTTHPTAGIAGFELLIDGVLYASTSPGAAFSIDTTELSDGWHELRVLGYDDTFVKSTGRWVGGLLVSNRGRSVTLRATPLTGDYATRFDFEILPVGGRPIEVRLVQNGRVIAAAPGGATTLSVYGLTLGGGASDVQAEVLHLDGRLVRSGPFRMQIEPAGGTPASQAPVAFGYTQRIMGGHTHVLELPAIQDDLEVTLSYEIVTPPSKASLGGLNDPYRLLRPDPGAIGVDALTFRVQSPFGVSNTATIHLVYECWFGDLNCDGLLDNEDIDPFVLALTDPAAYATTWPNCDYMLADINRDGVVDNEDIDAFVLLLTAG